MNIGVIAMLSCFTAGSLFASYRSHDDAECVIDKQSFFGSRMSLLNV